MRYEIKKIPDEEKKIIIAKNAQIKGAIKDTDIFGIWDNTSQIFLSHKVSKLAYWWMSEAQAEAVLKSKIKKK